MIHKLQLTELQYILYNLSITFHTYHNNIFTHSSNNYKQVHGCAFHHTANPTKVWDRYFDDVFSIMKKDAVSTFHVELNSILTHTSLLL